MRHTRAVDGCVATDLEAINFERLDAVCRLSPGPERQARISDL